MKIAIAGGHGQIALLLARLVTDAGHDAVAVIRNPAHRADVEQQGATALVVDLEQVDDDELALRLRGVDAVVFAAGAGPNSGAERKETVDRDAALLLADAAERMGIDRYVMISAMAADSYDPERAVVPARSEDDVFQVYLRAKSEADANIRARNLRWTIVRPGALLDTPPQGTVAVGRTVPRGSIPRADVAAVVLHALLDDSAVGVQFEVTSGNTPIPAALHALG
ncbi:NAD(P)H-binding protein [Curtobacterium sp. Csp1]|uniref:NAD(P)H-binding protein n=1 Tax=Curtobacterium TaxID=2034 RepID=UPI000735FCB0|nr:MULTISPECIES: NAD(P)H-binding protein [Curtobacterium]KTR03950.1 NAD-dependent dehydratase [Curtobacterium citreum]QKS13776.1 NAD(P)H-binding protein [Curtobacterium sp. csp3]QKS20819.1 NAD(P)H-binding protein [Curtobacterium sp. Csp1]RDI00176.1 putative NADH-flavin reductase [Curtobacterium sp. AG1037]